MSFLVQCRRKESFSHFNEPVGSDISNTCPFYFSILFFVLTNDKLTFSAINISYQMIVALYVCSILTSEIL